MSVFDIYAIAGRFPPSADTMLVDTRLTDDQPLVFLAVDTPRRDPKDIIFVNPADGTPAVYSDEEVVLTKPMPDHDWNEHYASGHMPWDSNEPDPALVATVEAGMIRVGRALEVGCGTGTNALWLAAHGFDALGVDLSSLAIDRARAKMGDRAIACRFEVLDFLKDPPAGPFDFVFDRGCFHVFDAARTRARFAASVARVLSPGGLWLSLVGSTEGAPRDTGPPRRSVRDIASAVEPALEIVQLRSIHFDTEVDMPPAAWLCLSRVRAVPAQPSTR